MVTVVKSWLRIFPSLSSLSIPRLSQLHIATHRSATLADSIHTVPVEPPSEGIATALCDSMRKGLSWEALSRGFGPAELSDSLVQKVLLQLKQPIDAKRALAFFHWSAHRMRFKHHTLSYCIAIHILVRARLIKDARALLESILTRDVADNASRFDVVDSLLASYSSTDSTPLAFDLLIQMYSKLRMFDVAFDVCKYLGERGFDLGLISYNTLMHVVQKSDQTTLVWKIYEHMILKRTYPNEVTVRIMVSALCKEGKLQQFVDIIDRIHGKRCSPAVIVNTRLVYRMLEEGRVEEGMVVLKRMLQKNMILDTISYSLVVCARVRVGGIDSAWEAYEEMLKRGFNANSFVYTLFIGTHCREGRVEAANSLIQEMESMGLKPYDETFNHLIVGCSEVGRLEESLRFSEKMVDVGLVPSCHAFNKMVGKLCESGSVKKADEMLTVLLDNGFVPDGTTYCHLIAGYAMEGNMQVVLKLYYEMEYRSLSPDPLVFELLIERLRDCGRSEDAEKIIVGMRHLSLTPSASACDRLTDCHLEKGDKKREL